MQRVDVKRCIPTAGANLNLHGCILMAIDYAWLAVEKSMACCVVIKVPVSLVLIKATCVCACNTAFGTFLCTTLQVSLALIFTGYFFVDFVDIVVTGQTKVYWEVIAHHIVVSL